MNFVMLENTESFIRALFAHFQKHKLLYVVLRNYETYPHSLHKPDIGLLVSPWHKNLMVKLFRDVCQEFQYQCIVRHFGFNIVSLEAIQLMSLEPLEQGISVDARTYEVFKFHPLMKRVPGFNYKVFFNQIKRRLVNYDGCEFYVFDQPDETIMLLKQWQRKMDPRHQKKIMEDFQTIEGVDRERLRALMKNPHHSDFDKLLGRMAEERWGKNTPFRMILTSLKVLFHSIERLPRSLPPIFYFSGPDGSGKTTAVNEVKGLLERHKIRYKYFYTLHKILRHIGNRFLWCQHLITTPKEKRLKFKQFIGLGQGYLDRDTGSVF